MSSSLLHRKSTTPGRIFLLNSPVVYIVDLKLNILLTMDAEVWIGAPRSVSCITLLPGQRRLTNKLALSAASAASPLNVLLTSIYSMHCYHGIL